ncbi:MAG: hypothetical protein EOP47_27940, partial [Sphingobacteriaceae bacterium]
QNLISNALKFKRPDLTPHIHVRYEAALSAPVRKGEFLHRIVVADNGIGFDEKHAEEIFVVFKRLHSYHEYEGTGVGLSICKKIVDKHKLKQMVQHSLKTITITSATFLVQV